jgi:hypothetical protein
MFPRSASLSILTALCCASFQAQNTTFAIHVLNGKTGKPVARQRLLLFGGVTPDDAKLQKIHLDLTTDDDGAVSVIVDPAKFHVFQLWPDFMTRCAPQLETFSVETIHRTGATSENNCSRTVTSAPTPASSPSTSATQPCAKR